MGDSGVVILLYPDDQDDPDEVLCLLTDKCSDCDIDKADDDESKRVGTVSNGAAGSTQI